MCFWFGRQVDTLSSFSCSPGHSCAVFVVWQDSLCYCRGHCHEEVLWLIGVISVQKWQPGLHVFDQWVTFSTVNSVPREMTFIGGQEPHEKNHISFSFNCLSTSCWVLKKVLEFLSKFLFSRLQFPFNCTQMSAKMCLKSLLSIIFLLKKASSDSVMLHCLFNLCNSLAISTTFAISQLLNYASVRWSDKKKPCSFILNTTRWKNNPWLLFCPGSYCWGPMKCQRTINCGLKSLSHNTCIKIDIFSSHPTFMAHLCGNNLTESQRDQTT